MLPAMLATVRRKQCLWWFPRQIQLLVAELCLLRVARDRRRWSDFPDCLKSTLSAWWKASAAAGATEMIASLQASVLSSQHPVSAPEF